jgi:hypothetical protein
MAKLSNWIAWSISRISPLRKEFVHAFRQVPGDIIVLASVGKIRPDFGATRSARGT